MSKTLIKTQKVEGEQKKVCTEHIEVSHNGHTCKKKEQINKKGVSPARL